jgi:hypothetical protein
MSEQQLIQQLQAAVAELHTILSGNAHGILRGSHEAALAEAQGAQIVRNVCGQGATFAHIRDLENTAQALMSRYSQVQSVLGKIGEVDRGVMIRSKEALQPMLQAAQQNISLLERTRNVAADLMRTHPNRLSGVYFGQGGLGPATGRTHASLISTQIQQMAATLRARGIEPSLIPRAHAAGNALMATLRQAPVTIQDAGFKIATAAAAARAAFTQAALRAAATSAAQSLLRGLAAAMEALLTVGGRLITVPIIIIDPRQLERRGPPTEA